MLTQCRLSAQARTALTALLPVPSGMQLSGAEVEFKELPYFLVTRSRTTWDAEKMGDINVISLEAVSERGLVVDPQVAGATQRLTLIPWANVISLSCLFGGTESETDKA